MTEFAPTLEQSLHEAKLQKGPENPQLLHVERYMLLNGANKNHEGLLMEFFLNGREVRAHGEIGARKGSRAAGAHFGKGSRIAEGGAERGRHAMQQAAVGQQTSRPVGSAVLTQAAIKLADSERGQKTLTRQKTRWCSADPRRPVGGLGNRSAPQVHMIRLAL